MGDHSYSTINSLHDDIVDDNDTALEETVKSEPIWKHYRRSQTLRTYYINEYEQMEGLIRAVLYIYDIVNFYRMTRKNITKQDMLNIIDWYCIINYPNAKFKYLYNFFIPIISDCYQLSN